MSKPDLSSILISPRLPSLPAVALQVLELTRKPQVNLEEVARVIRNDQGLAVKVLRTVNSSYYGLSRPCETIKQAIVYLGLSTVKTLTLGFSLVESLGGGDGEAITFNYVEYWRRAMLSAVASREIAGLTRKVDPEAAFLGALMQDLGMVAMHRVLGDKYIQAVDMARGEHAALSAIELKAFDFDHSIVGAEIAAKWKLPPQFVDVIRHHGHSSTAPEGSREITRIVELASRAAESLGSGKADAALARFHQDAASWYGLSSAQVGKTLSVVAEASKELASLFRLEIGTLPDVQQLLDQAEDLIVQHEATLASAQNGPGSAPAAKVA